MTVPGGIDHRREGGGQRLLGRLVVFVLWLIAVLLFGLVECSIFWLSAIDGSGCPSGGSLDIFGPTRTGGAASGGALLTAIVSGLSLWLAAGFLALWLRGRLGFVMFGFVAVYGLSLLALWPIASLIWGPRQCGF
ncbi:MAG: hypothetical protein E6G19_02830 [Actinobacteria bacterium]|nr:MAG: hypothetical protein E6G19_02830 [Actinomycetota bacterium]